MGEHRPERDRERRLTMVEAAQVLGISKDGVRMRVRRGTLRSEKGEDGRVHVFVVPDRHTVPPGDPDPAEAAPPSRELVEEMRGRIEDLREQLAAEREAHREARRIIAGLVQRVPELEAARQEPRESSLSAEEEAPTSTPQEEDRGAPERGSERPQSEAPRRSPWWRRIIGG